MFPGVAAVGGMVQSAAGAAAREAPGSPPRLPQGREQDARVGWVHAEVDGPGIGVFSEDLLPGLAAVAGAVDAALRVGPEGMAQDGRVGQVGVLGMHDDPADLPLLLPDVFPGFAAVGGAVDAVAGLDVAANVRLARADV